MASLTPPRNNDYMFSDRDDSDEERRLRRQHHLAVQVLNRGHYVDPAIPTDGLHSVADLGCGTGVWLDSVARTYLPNASDKDFHGFDINAGTFLKNLEPGVHLHHHDCSQPFDTSYHGRFDLVGIHLLCYALPIAKFEAVIRNAALLLKPGGYLHWAESEFWNIEPVEQCHQLHRAIQIIGKEREHMGFAPYMPTFMLKTIIELRDSPPNPHAPPPHRTVLSLVQYRLNSLLQKDSIDRVGLEPNNVFSDCVLEAFPIMLEFAARRMDGTDSQDDASEARALAKFFKESLSGPTPVKLKAHFPALVAQKSKWQG